MSITRKRFLVGAGLVGGGIAVGGVRGLLAADEAGADDGTGHIAFHGTHQAGILTPQQDRLHFAAFDLTTSNVKEVRDLMRAWTEAAAAMTAGALVGSDTWQPTAPPDDTGEALGLLPNRLTITFGFGPSLFRADGEDRFGLARRMPPALKPLPDLPGDEIDRAISHGDLCVQACSDDPQAAFHAVRNLARIARGVAVLRWSQLGFGRTSSTSQNQQTPRNLMGFKDGTNNITAEESDAVHRKHVWADSGDGADWMHDGSYMVTRRIRMLIEVWDRASLADQEQTIGRLKASGAPIGGSGEHDDPDFKAKDDKGMPLIPDAAHVRIASPDNNRGIRMLRRGYSFTDGFDDQLGQLDAGLFFIAYQRNPHKQFVPVQRRLGANDQLNEYIVHRSSGLFAVPPGIPDRPGRFIGDSLLN
ncbi:MAG: deferrochelatase/peroxidase EfeB [Actinobacteria bacterium]|nr:deferrochelatase/peroxidase EfeB [Actinomycetota bacterium]